MPIHDWTRVQAGTFHFFHQRWIAALCDALNLGGLPDGDFAMSAVDAKWPTPRRAGSEGVAVVATERPRRPWLCSTRHPARDW